MKPKDCSLRLQVKCLIYYNFISLLFDAIPCSFAASVLHTWLYALASSVGSGGNKWKKSTLNWKKRDSEREFYWELSNQRFSPSQRNSIYFSEIINNFENKLIFCRSIIPASNRLKNVNYSLVIFSRSAHWFSLIIKNWNFPYIQYHHNSQRPRIGELSIPIRCLGKMRKDMKKQKPN